MVRAGLQESLSTAGVRWDSASVGYQSCSRKLPSQQHAYSPHVGDRAGTGTGLSSSWAPHSTDSCECDPGRTSVGGTRVFKTSFDEDKDGRLAGEGGQPNRQAWKQNSGRGGMLRVWQDLRERPARAQMGAMTSVVCLQEALLFPPENLRAE